MNTALDEQLKKCKHRPFLHNMLNNHFECLCGQTSIPIADKCPVIECLCGREKSRSTYE